MKEAIRTAVSVTCRDRSEISMRSESNVAISRGASVRVRRGEQILNESVIESPRRFKDDVNEVAAGYECGVGVKDFDAFEVGDTLEFFRKEKA